METLRYIRLMDAPRYLGMDRNRFNKEVRPELIEIPIGKRCIAFDRIDLDSWADHYKQSNGRPAQRSSVWDIKKCQDLPCVTVSGTSTKKLTDDEFTKALDQVASQLPKNI